MSYEPNPPPDQVEAFQPFGGRPLALLRVGAGLLARKGQAEPILEPAAEKRATLEAPATRAAPAGGDRPETDRAPDIEAEASRHGVAEADAVAKASLRADAAKTSVRELCGESAETLASDVRPAIAEMVAPSDAAVEPRALICLDVTAAEFVRLSIASAQLGTPVPQIFAAALAAYLDAKGIKSAEACGCVARIGAQFSKN